MQAKKSIGIVLLVAFALLASSVVCLASSQVGVMNDCSAGHGGAVAACPFMSVSIPALVTGATLVLLAFAIFLAIAVISGKQELAGISFASYERRRVRSRAAFFDPVISLISRGVLHSRVYSF